MGERHRIGGATRIAGVIGWPIEHSLSPVIHNAAYEALGLDWVYVAMPVAPGAAAAAVAGLEALGFAGANVTMPHKEAVADALGSLTEDAALLRAVNTIQVTPDGLVGHNTDAPGFGRFLERDAGFDAAGRTALVFGAGGRRPGVRAGAGPGGLRAHRGRPARAGPRRGAARDPRRSRDGRRRRARSTKRRGRDRTSS